MVFPNTTETRTEIRYRYVWKNFTLYYEMYDACSISLLYYILNMHMPHYVNICYSFPKNNTNSA